MAVATVDSVTSPLVLRHPDGREQLVAGAFTHPAGLLYLDLYWHRATPEESAHLLRGTISGDGPWRIGDHRLRTLGCQHTDPHLHDDHMAWQRYLDEHTAEYPPRAQTIDIARRLGATPRSD